jgi:hypothetical protein
MATSHETPALASTSPGPLRKMFSQLGWVSAAQQEAAIELIAYVQESLRGAFEYAHISPSALGGGVAQAQAQREQFKRLLLARPEMLAPGRAATVAGLSRRALDLRRKKGQALALMYGKRGYRYPVWQFADAIAPLMLALLPQVAHLGAWAQYLLLTEPEPLLDGKSIVETLQAGDVDRARLVLEILRQTEAP